MKKDIGSKIRQIRELKGYSQEYMASQLNVSQHAYSKLETGKTKMDWERVTKIAVILDVDPLDIASFDDNLVFNNCTQSGKFEQFNNYLPKELTEQYEKRIEALQNEIDFLRKMVLKKSD